MEKKDLKSLVTQMHDELIENINSQEEATKEQIITFLQDAIATISLIHDDELDSVEHAKHAFINAYKEIANTSIASYKETNDTFSDLTQIHQETIDQCSSVHIDLPSITEKFTMIQDQMTNEVEKANKVITNLSLKVKTLERTSNLDALTKVFNRRALTTFLEKLCARDSIKEELHLLILDIDDFKIVNDTYGHIAGDKVLIFISNILRKTLRDGDKIFRYGGEEFVIILNRINFPECAEITKRILKLISSNQLIYKGNTLSVTMSIGATRYYPNDTPDTLINRADKALYKSKKLGKNQMNSELLSHGH